MEFNTSKETKKIGTITVLYSEGGLGKTSIIGGAVLDAGDEGVIISVGEDGVTPLKTNKVAYDLTGINHVDSIIKDWSTLKEVAIWAGKSKYKVVAFDSLSMIMDSLEDYCFQKYYIEQKNLHGKDMTEEKLRMKAYGFQKSDLLNYMAKEWDEFLKIIQRLREVGANVLISTHTTVKKGRIVSEELEYDLLDLDMPSNKNQNLAKSLYNCADLFLYGKHDITVIKGDKRNTAETNGRVLQTESDAYVKAKNRAGMPATIPATWEDLKQYI